MLKKKTFIRSFLERTHQWIADIAFQSIAQRFYLGQV
jgi:hypothetical protein